MTKATVAYVGLLALVAGGAVALRAPSLPRPVDSTEWREADVASIARNFYREGMNPLAPRVDWRGDGPGFVEMEFPFLSWGAAAAYWFAGVHETIGRWVTFLPSLATLLVFLLLARDRLPRAGVVAAGLAFAWNPLNVRLSTALQPEAHMLLGIVAGVYFFCRWLDRGDTRAYWLSMLSIAFAALAKLNALHVGLLLAALCWERFGWSAARRPRLWLFALGALAPVVAWYAHALSFWHVYGNSLGLSNQYHWIGVEFLEHPRRLLDIGLLDARHAWGWAGLALTVLGLLAARRWREFAFEWYWLAAVAVYYLAAARTTSAQWAYYYHIAAVPPASLAIGRAFAHAVGSWPQFSGTVATPGRLGRLARAGVAVTAVFLLSASAVLAARRTIGAIEASTPSPLFLCAKAFAPAVPAGDLIVATGGPCTDRDGRPVAHDAPYMFYWLDRKGFAVCEGELSIPRLQALAGRGAAVFVAETDSLRKTPNVSEGELRNAYPVLAERREAILFGLQPGLARAVQPNPR